MKRFIAKYLLYIYTKYIIDNNSNINICKERYIPIMKVLIIYLNLCMWTYAIIFLPFLIIGMIIDENGKNLLRLINIYSINLNKIK
jgi:hypothetical protein